MKEDHEAREREARRDLDRIENEGGMFGSPAMRNRAKSVRDHFAARDADQHDAIEVAATRTGRVLALVAFIALAFWLFSAYAA